jgi:hypothetical protein
MKTRFMQIIIGVVILTLAQGGLAQTAAQTTKAIPRTADGKPDLAGKWKTINSSVSPMQLTAWGAERWAYNRLPSGRGGRPELDPELHCYLSGLARIGPPLQVPARSVIVRIDDESVPAPGGPAAFDAIQIAYAPNRVLIIYNYNQEYRQIFTDGRTHPEDVEEDPYSRWWNGFSTGTWDGDTFVVETTNLRDETWVDNLGHEARQLRIVERFRRVDAETLQIGRTLTDRVALARPYTTSATLKLTPNLEFQENVICGQYYFRSFAFGYDSLLGIWTHPYGGEDKSSSGPIFTQLPK